MLQYIGQIARHASNQDMGGLAGEFGARLYILSLQAFFEVGDFSIELAANNEFVMGLGGAVIAPVTRLNALGQQLQSPVHVAGNVAIEHQ